MMDAPDEFLAARFAALANPHDDSDWLDVRRRAGTRRSRRWIALPLAAAFAAVLVGSAFAFYGKVVDFLSAEPAPERIVVDFDKMRASASVVLGPNVIPGEARRIMSAVIEGDTRPLYVAPTSDGGFCWRWYSIGRCGRIRDDEPSLGVGGLDGAQGGAAQLYGHIFDSGAERLELEYEDGVRTEIPFVWVTPPIDAGFFYFEVPSEHLIVGHRAAVLTAYGENGNEVARRELLLRP